ncbi:PLP-dependent aminotransferase family protein [Isoptericola croceus]|uniref:MocR-like transcription factor YczR n=1 Tax=Isoptericola croceus TaxID=3031406 RepID=UPI0023F7BF1E|nr:PLP-dependent aminotransferase family protein [Isoptericola croceus]
MSLATPTTTAVRSLSAPAASRLLGAWHTSGPAYLALADALRSAVLSGSLAPLTRLPSERELARTLGLSRTTTSAAYARLRELGFATSQVGSGTVAILPRSAGLPVRPQSPAGDGPLPPLSDTSGPIEMSQATPSAPDALHGAYERALEMLPAYLGTGGYAHLGLDVLREAIANRYAARGVPTTPDQVLVTTGGQQAIALLATTLVGRTEPVVVESPTYYHAIEALQRAGARVIGVPTGDVESLASAVHRTRARLAYLVPDFHNPTGRTLSADERAAVAHLTGRYGVTVVGDETLTDLDLDGGTVPGPFCGDGTDARLVSVGSASKSFWGGIRIGWVRADPQLVQRLARTRQALDIATPVLEQLTVVELLARRDEILPARVAGLRERRDLLVGLVRDRFPEWDVPVPPGGLCLWTGIGRPVAQALAAAAVAEGLRIGAGPQFTPDGSARDRIRLIYTGTPEKLTAAVDRLANAWQRVTR